MENEIQRQRNEHKDDTSGPAKDDDAPAEKSDAVANAQPKAAKTTKGGDKPAGGDQTH